MVIFEEGNIQYICEDCVYHPSSGDIILIPPGKFHMSVINCERTHYKRHIFYLYSSAFDKLGHSALTSFLNRTTKGDMFRFGLTEAKQALMDTLVRLKESFDSEPSPLEEALGLSYIIQVFY